jgi:hypothetical protein
MPSTADVVGLGQPIEGGLLSLARASKGLNRAIGPCRDKVGTFFADQPGSARENEIPIAIGDTSSHGTPSIVLPSRKIDFTCLVAGDSRG